MNKLIVNFILCVCVMLALPASAQKMQKGSEYWTTKVQTVALNSSAMERMERDRGVDRLNLSSDMKKAMVADDAITNEVLIGHFGLETESPDGVFSVNQRYDTLMVAVADIGKPFGFEKGKYLVPLYTATNQIVSSFMTKEQHDQVLLAEKQAEAVLKKAVEDSARAELRNEIEGGYLAMFDSLMAEKDAEWRRVVNGKDSAKFHVLEKDKLIVAQVNGQDVVYEKNEKGNWVVKDPNGPVVVTVKKGKKSFDVVYTPDENGVWTPDLAATRNFYKYGIGEFAGYRYNYFRHACNGAPIGSAGQWASVGGGYAPVWNGGGWNNGWNQGYGQFCNLGGGVVLGFSFGFGSYNQGVYCYNPPPCCGGGYRTIGGATVWDPYTGRHVPIDWVGGGAGWTNGGSYYNNFYDGGQGGYYNDVVYEAGNQSEGAMLKNITSSVDKPSFEERFARLSDKHGPKAVLSKTPTQTTNNTSRGVRVDEVGGQTTNTQTSKAPTFEERLAAIGDKHGPKAVLDKPKVEVEPRFEGFANNTQVGVKGGQPQTSNSASTEKPKPEPGVSGGNTLASRQSPPPARGTQTTFNSGARPSKPTVQQKPQMRQQRTAASAQPRNYVPSKQPVRGTQPTFNGGSRPSKPTVQQKPQMRQQRTVVAPAQRMRSVAPSRSSAKRR